ncbi:MAG: tRNA pseudouridine(55) synthase TruB [Clostridia bacterium]|nr:tRNA pseudouridine(55) synthase TruB [Clostridia bacterium]
MNGFLNILKPPGMTSAAVVARVRRLTGEKRVGHAGTLDPEAAGVLPIMIGKAARLFDFLVDKEKEYVAEAAFGVSTDTQDATGRVTERGDSYPSYDTVVRMLKRLEGDIVQRPGMFSAIKKDGKPMYELARKGETAEVPERVVHVESIVPRGEMRDHGVLMTVRCGRGTYIRSICDDLGRLCGCPAHMRFLLRTQSGAFTIDTAMTIGEAETLQQRGELAAHLLPPDMPLGHMPKAVFSENARRLITAGAKLPVGADLAGKLPDGVNTRVYLDDEFWGIAVRDGDHLIWRAQIAPEET